ncbi:hypothetical protein CHGG_08716 [Chaetomium globosum CBS 148.51]|uniref:Uncharacterized protein n=1 Tax=Chaetomium globosum (strain ATCC 6205 / CBS 148.51 / DSM 1962 / NBRC 6347 / NRRL 1970) TaxID=306901 RepID=Q2GTI8_CHAGB|nr:uncharacterized protein CHGG_08716 [Chaetomium globosum CBS 148.51]EAQ84702.1 hypothetical protein CHGG_08716 [Chaetomium globosum CBS 148.51]
MATFPDHCLPPEGIFETRKALFESINAYAKPRGYAFTTQRSIRGPGGFLRLFFACDRSRRLPLSPERDRQRKTTAPLRRYIHSYQCSQKLALRQRISRQSSGKVVILQHAKTSTTVSPMSAGNLVKARVQSMRLQISSRKRAFGAVCSTGQIDR